HGEFPRFVEAVRRTLGLIFELIAGAAHAGAGGIAALDHEVGDDAMEDGSVVEALFALFACDGMFPLAVALSQVNEVGDSFGSVFVEQAADNGAFGGLEDGVGAGRTGHRNPFSLSKLFGQVALSGLSISQFRPARS